MSKKKPSPPTIKQLHELKEHINHQAMTPHLDELLSTLPMQIKSRSETARILMWMKTIIRNYEIVATSQWPKGANPYKPAPDQLQWIITDGYTEDITKDIKWVTNPNV
jgi:hypothetical protein